MAIAMVDQIFLKGKFGLGSEMERGLAATGPLVLSMAGIMCIAPVLGGVLGKAVTPLFGAIGVDPAMISGMLLAVDMGGLTLAQTMTANPDVVMLSGVILSSMMGVTIVFTIPVILGLCRDEDMKEVLMGIVLGVISIPVGLIVGAIAAGIPFSTLIANSLPVLVLCIALAIVLILFPTKILIVFRGFGAFLKAVCLFSLLFAAMEEILGITVIPGMDPLGEQLQTIGIIGIRLAGAYPLVAVLKRVLAPALTKIGNMLGINEVSVAGMVACLANAFPLFDMVKDMDSRGKVVALAFGVPALSAFGAHLGYVSTAVPEGVGPMIVGKLAAGIAAVLFAECFMKYGFRRDVNGRMN